MNAFVLCGHNTLVGVANAALGGEKTHMPSSAPPSGIRDVGLGHEKVEDAVAAINKMLMGF